MEVQAGSKGMNGGGAPGDTLLNYELYGNLREADGGERYRSVCAQCYGRLSSALADWGTREGVERVMLGLSGGLDSALVAEVATRVFGAEKVLTVFMPSEFTSTMSHEDARELAMNLGVEMLTMPIDGLRREAARVVEEANVGGCDGLWGENVQARLRAVLAMAVSNRRGHVLLNTSNRSEILVGYSTLYGDTCGAVSVLGDLYKTEVIALARWVNNCAGRALIPERIIRRPPSAELRADQKDEDSLPKYSVLDPILAMMMGEGRFEDRLMVGFGAVELARLTEEVMERVHRDAFKRKQLAPTLPVYGRRMPDGASQQRNG